MGTLTVPDRFNAVATYPLAVVRHAPNPGGAQAFVASVLALQQALGFHALLVTHDPEDARVLASERLVIEQGRVVGAERTTSPA